MKLLFITTWRPGLHNRFPRPKRDVEGSGISFLKRSQLLMSGIFMFLRLEEQRIPHPAH